MNNQLLIWNTSRVVSIRGRTYSYDGYHHIISHTPYKLYQLGINNFYLFFQTSDYSIEYEKCSKISVIKSWLNTARWIRYEKSNNIIATKYDNRFKVTVTY